MNKIPKALLVIDAQKYFSKSKKTKQIVKRISAYLEFNINSYKVVVKIPQIKDSLEEKQIKEVDICGFDTDCCVLATASTSKEKLHNPVLKMIERNIGFVKAVV